MNKSTIKNALVKGSGGALFINRGQIKSCMGWSNDRVNYTVKGLSYISLGRTRQYDIDEVASRIMQQVQ